jgi:hypothetical protein
MGNEIYKQHGFFCFICILQIDVVGHFSMDLVKIIHHKKKNIFIHHSIFFICVQSIHRCIFIP